jgi:uncharacterized glyoxalase superfamily protein PhnB
MHALRVAPVLLVRDIHASVAFWRDRVGFDTGEIHGDPPNFAMPTRDGVTFMLVQVPQGTDVPPPHWRIVEKVNQAYVWVDDVDALYEELQGRGARIDFTIYDTPWGTREFGIQDLDDHDIAFGQAL